MASALQKKNINYMVPYSAKAQRSEKKSKTVWLVLFPAVSAVVLLGIFGYYKINATMMRAQINQINAYMTAPETVSSLEEAAQLSDELATLTLSAKELTALYTALESYPTLDRAVFTKTIGCAKTVELQAYDYIETDSTLTLTCSGNSETQASEFVARLRQSGVYSALGYTGYTKGDGTYDFTVIGQLAK